MTWRTIIARPSTRVNRRVWPPHPTATSPVVSRMGRYLDGIAGMSCGGGRGDIIVPFSSWHLSCSMVQVVWLISDLPGLLLNTHTHTLTHTCIIPEDPGS
jgi:hypothetical protein